MKILYLSYFFPPLGGPAALRNLKVVKYLCRQGAEIDLISVDDIQYPYYDTSLESELLGLRVFRTPSWDPMSLLRKLRRGTRLNSEAIYSKSPERLKLLIRRLYPLDDKIGWLPFMLRQARQLVKENSYDLIYVSCGPFSAAAGALQLSRSLGIPLVYEARDYWTLLSDYRLQGFWQGRLAASYEKAVLSHCSLFVTATEGIRRDCSEAFDPTLLERSLTVYNGWDEEDFAPMSFQADSTDVGAGFELAYFGSIYARRSLRYFYRAVNRLRSELFLPDNTVIKLYGNYGLEVAEEIQESGIADLIRIVPSLPHREALEAMQKASVLLLVINSSSPRGTLTSKLFEYYRSRKPILAMVPAHNEAAELLRHWGQNYICAMESEDSIYHCLKDMITETGRGLDYELEMGYCRKAQISKLWERLNLISPKA